MAVSQPPQRCLATLLIGLPCDNSTFAPFGAGSTWLTQTSLHLGQSIGAATAGAVLTVALRSTNCARTLGEALMPSSPAGLYWARTGPANESKAMAANVAIRVLFVVCIFLWFFLFSSLLRFI